MTEQHGSWRIRRLFMFIISAFCVGAVSYVLLNGSTGEVAETAVTMSFFTLMSIVGSYVFGAVWDDNNARSAKPR